MLVVIRAIVLGIVQGVTEFIPISSSAHLIIFPWLFGWTDPGLTSLPFDVALHLGTLVAVLWYFAAEWVRLVRAFFASIAGRSIRTDPDRRLAWMLILGCIPGAIVGVLAESKIESLFHEANVPVKPAAMIALAFIMAFMGLLLFLAERLAHHIRCLPEMRFRDALLIGLAQAAAIFPGVSRSGSTITAGLALGFQREDAARFSFMLSAPIIAGAGLKSLATVIAGLKSGVLVPAELLLFPIGFASAAISGYFVIKFLLGYLRRHSTDIFVYYRWAMSALIVVVVILRG